MESGALALTRESVFVTERIIVTTSACTIGGGDVTELVNVEGVWGVVTESADVAGGTGVALVAPERAERDAAADVAWTLIGLRERRNEVAGEGGTTIACLLGDVLGDDYGGHSGDKRDEGHVHFEN